MSGDIRTTEVHTTHRHRDAVWAAIIADANADEVVRQFGNRQAFIDWFVRTNHKHGHYGSGTSPTCGAWHGWLLDSTFEVPEGFNVADIGCTPTQPAPSQPTPSRPQPVTPQRPQTRAVDPTFMYPAQASPDDFNMLRAGYLAGVLPIDPPDAAARGQVHRRNSAGTWSGPGDGNSIEDVPVGVYGTVGSLLGGPIGGVIGALVGDGVRSVAADSDDTAYQRGAARQPYAMFLRGWKANPDGSFERINPGDHQDDPAYTETTDGLSSWRLTLSSGDYGRNWDSRTQARVTQAMASPNAMAGIMSIRGLSNQVDEELRAFRADPHGPDAQKHVQRALDLTAAASRTEFAQVSGMNEEFDRVQRDLVAEATRAGIQASSLRQYNMSDPNSIPNLGDFPSGPVHPLIPRTYQQMLQDPGFDGNDIPNEEEYNRRFVTGINYDSVYQRALGTPNDSKRETALGFSRSPQSRAEVDQLTTAGMAVVNKDASTRAAFVQSVREDSKFGRLIGYEINDWIQHPEQHGFATREAAIAKANEMLGEEVVNSEILASATAVPEDENPGRIRHDEILARAFAAHAGSDDARVQWFLQHSVDYPQDPNVRQNVRGATARAILTQIDYQQGTDGPTSHGPAFNAIAQAAGLDANARTQWAEQLRTLSNFNVDNSRGTTGYYTANDAVRAETLADEALSPGVTRRVVNQDGTAAPVTPEVQRSQDGQPVVTNTGVQAVAPIQQTEVTQGTPAATLQATRAILADPGMRNVALQSLAMYDRRMAAGLIVGSMSDPRNRDAYDRVLHNLRSGENLPPAFERLDRSQRRLLASCLEDAASAERSLNERWNRPDHGGLTPQEYATRLAHGQRELRTYLRVIDSQLRPTGERILYQDENGRMRAPQNMQEIREMADAFEATDRARDQGKMPDGPVTRVDEHGRVVAVRGSEARSIQRDARDGGFANQYAAATQGQDSIVALMQMIGMDPEANQAMGRTLDQVQAGLSARDATSTLGAIDASRPERDTTGVGPSTSIRPDIRDVENIQSTGDPALDAALARARMANAGTTTTRDVRASQAQHGAPVGDILTTLAFIIGAAVHGGGGGGGGEPNMPDTGIPGGPCCGPVITPPVSPPIDPTGIPLGPCC